MRRRTICKLILISNISPDGRKFRSRNELRQYLEKQGLDHLNPEDFDFSIWGRGNGNSRGRNANNSVSNPSTEGEGILQLPFKHYFNLTIFYKLAPHIPMDISPPPNLPPLGSEIPLSYLSPIPPPMLAGCDPPTSYPPLPPATSTQLTHSNPPLSSGLEVVAKF